MAVHRDSAGIHVNGRLPPCCQASGQVVMDIIYQPIFVIQIRDALRRNGAHKTLFSSLSCTRILKSKVPNEITYLDTWPRTGIGPIDMPRKRTAGRCDNDEGITFLRDSMVLKWGELHVY